MNTRAQEPARLRGLTRGEATLLLLSLALVAYAYWPLTRNYFYADDFLNLYNIVNRGILEYVLTPHGGHVLVTRNVLFLLSHALFGANPVGYFAVALATHLLNVVLLFLVIRRLTQRPRLAAFGAALWGMNPINAGALGWYSVYGQVVVATIFLSVLLQVARVADGSTPARAAPWRWAVLLLMASTCFGSGIAITLAFPLAAWLLLPPGPSRPRIVRALATAAVLVMPLYVVLYWLYYSFYGAEPDPLPTLLSGLGKGYSILALLFYLFTYGTDSLLFGVLLPRVDFPSTAAFVTIGLFATALAVALWRGPTRSRRQLLVCLLFSVASYGIIAAGRVTFFAYKSNPAWAEPPRFHYLGPIPIAIMLCLLFAHVDARQLLSTATRNSLLLAWVITAVVLQLHFGVAIDHHPLTRQETEEALATMRRRITETPAGETVYIPYQPFRSGGLLLARSPKRLPGWAALFAIFFPDNVVDQKRVVFVVTNPEIIAAGRNGRRTSTLLIPPEQVDPRILPSLNLPSQPPPPTPTPRTQGPPA